MVRTIFEQPDATAMLDEDDADLLAFTGPEEHWRQRPSPSSKPRKRQGSMRRSASYTT